LKEGSEFHRNQGDGGPRAFIPYCPGSFGAQAPME
jgi:hypothetical protein